MKLPIYSNLKTKLESKGLDSITSGQIAWFVCSVGVSFIFCTLFIVGGNILANSLNNIFDILHNRPFDFLKFVFIFIFILNLLYLYNILPLVLGAILISTPIFLNIHFSVIYVLSLIIFLPIFFIKKTNILGFFIVYYFGITFVYAFWQLIYSLAR